MVIRKSLKVCDKEADLNVPNTVIVFYRQWQDTKYLILSCIYLIYLLRQKHLKIILKDYTPFHKQHFIKQCQAKIGRKLSKS